MPGALWFFGRDLEPTLGVVERFLRSNRSRDLYVAALLEEAGAEEPGSGWKTTPEALEGRLTVSELATVKVQPVPAGTGLTYGEIVGDAFNFVGCDALIVVSRLSPTERADRAVVVAPPLGEGQSYLVREKREVARFSGHELASALLDPYLPDGVSLRPFSAEDEEALRLEEEEGEVEVEQLDVVEIPDDVAALVKQLTYNDYPVMDTGLWLRPEYEYLREADTVVVPVEDEAQRSLIQAPLAELRDAFKDHDFAMRNQIPWRHDRLLTYTPCLHGKGDRETQRLLMTLKRAIAPW